MIGNPCVNGECSNVEGGYHCDCYSGYSEQEGVCLDVNEVDIKTIMKNTMFNCVVSAQHSP